MLKFYRDMEFLSNTSVKERLLMIVDSLNLTNQKFEIECNLSNGYIANMRKGIGEVALERISNRYPNINKAWLLLGEGEMFNQTNIVIGEETIRQERKKIPFYDDIATIGGTNELSSDTDNGNARVAEWIDAGDWFPEATSAIRHYGESMVEYPSGSILALKRVNDRRLIINGRNYVVETTEFRITKQLQDDGGDFLMAYSSNRETYPDGRQIHSPIRIPKDTIRHIDMVLGCVQKEYSNGAIPIRK